MIQRESLVFVERVSIGLGLGNVRSMRGKHQRKYWINPFPIHKNLMKTIVNIDSQSKAPEGVLI